MKKIVLYLSVLMMLTSANAQKVYFIYLQTDSQIPFYVRMGEKIYEAGNSGYLVLSKLRDSTYSLNIGINGSQISEQLFSVTVNKKDQGFLLKNFGEEGWGLFDLQSFKVVKSQSAPSANTVIAEKKESNSFNELLAKAADDSSLMQKPVTIKTEEKNNVIPDQKSETKEKSVGEMGSGSISLKADDSMKIDSSKVKNEEVRNEITKENKEVKSVGPVNEKKGSDKLTNDLYLRSTIVKHAESSTTEGFGLTFFDFLPNGTTDTISILIQDREKILLVPGIKKGEKKFLDIDSASIVQEKTNTLVTVQSDSSDVTGQQTSGAKNCAINATDDEVMLLKNKMAEEKSLENMINEAAKTFNTKCFTTAQIKKISSLFLSDEGKYKLFDAAYTHVSDVTDFSSLQSELKEEYFIRRFKAMIY